MGCAASSSARAVAPTPQPNPGSRSAGGNVGIGAAAHDPKAAGKVGAVPVNKGDGVTAGKDEVVAFQPTDEERSKNNTPAANCQDKGLGATSPKPNASADQELLELRADASPPLQAQQDVPLLPSMMEPLPAPVDVDAMKLPAAEASLVPYWEKDPLPARPGTSSRRPQSSGGKKLVVYKTEKTKKMEAESKKKRGDDVTNGPSPDKTPKRVSSLPPIKARRKKAASDASDFEVFTPLKDSPAGGGLAWDVDTSDLAAPTPERKQADVFSMDEAASPSPARLLAAEIFTVDE